MDENIRKRNNVKITGIGTQTIIFVPGFGCDQNIWRFVAPFFEKEYRVVLFDHVGSGKSDTNAYSSSKYGELGGYSQDVLDLCVTLNLKNAILVGHSVGCMIGMLASIQKPELFERLVMIGPSPCYLNDPPDYMGGFEMADLEGLLDMMEMNYIGWANNFAQVIMGNPERPELFKELEESFCSTDPVIANQFAKTTFFSDNRKDLKKVVVPSLLMMCSEDTIAPVEVGNYIHSNLPRSTIKLMQATGHCPHLSHPEETIRVICEYLSSDKRAKE